MDSQDSSRKPIRKLDLVLIPAFLRDFKLQHPAQTADADQRFLVVEYTLEAKNEASSGMVTDVTVS